MNAPKRPRIAAARIRGLELLAHRSRRWANSRAHPNSLFAPTAREKADALMAIKYIDQLVAWHKGRTPKEVARP